MRMKKFTYLRDFANNALDMLYTEGICYDNQCIGWKTLLGAVCDKRDLTEEELLCFHNKLRGPLLKYWDKILDLEVHDDDRFSHNMFVFKDLIKSKNNELYYNCQNVSYSFFSFIEKFVKDGNDIELLSREEIHFNIINKIKNNSDISFIDIIKVPKDYDDYKNEKLSLIENYVNLMNKNIELYSMAKYNKESYLELLEILKK